MHGSKGALIIVSVLLVALLLPLRGGPSAFASGPTISSTPDVQVGGQATVEAGVAGSQRLLATYNVLPGSRSWSSLWAWADYVANFDLRVVLPPNMTLLEWRKDGGTVTYDAATRTIHWTGTLPKNATWYLSFLLEFPCAPDGTSLGSWSYSGTIGTKYYSGTVGPYIVRWPDLSTSSKSGPATAQVGEEVLYEIILKNTGAISNTVSIRDLIPPGMGYVTGSAWASQGTPSYADGVVSWSGPMPANATVQMRFRARVDRQGTFINQLVIDEGIPECREPYTKTVTTYVGPPPTATLSPTPTLTRTPTKTTTPTRTLRPTYTATPTRTASPTAIPCRDLIVNGGFEQGLVGWWAWTDGGFDQPVALASAPVADGVRSSWLGTSEVLHRRGTAHLSQDVLIPANMQNVFLHFDYLVRTDELPPVGRLFDWFQFEVLDLNSGATLLQLPAVGVGTGWVHERVDLNPFRGRWLRLHFTVYNDGWMPTAAWVDGVHLCDGVAATAPSPTPGFIFKAAYADYSPSGVPDFDQRQAGWDCPPGSGTWAYCGPVAAANSIWWFDSKFEPNPQNPGVISDNYGLVRPYGSWDDHDARNVRGLIEELAQRMDTCGMRTNPNAWSGTYVDDLRDGIISLLEDRGLRDQFIVTMRRMPSYEWVAEEVERCEDVILMIGFYQPEGGGWQRVGGHFVTVVGVDINRRQIAISDPIKNITVPGQNPGAQNDAANVSHDVYSAVPSNSPGGTWALQAYAQTANARAIFRDVPMPQQADLQSALQQIVTEVEYAVAVSPVSEDADEQPAPPVVDMYWKGVLEAYVDYALAGMPDFDQRQAAWRSPRTGAWSFDGPVAVANSLWWFDSKFEPNPIPPPEINDNYPLVAAYSTWDDHDWRNVQPFVEDLAYRMDTDGRRTGGSHEGVDVEEMAAAIRKYLTDKGLVQDYTITLREAPSFDWVRGEVRRCEDVILLVGFWELQPDGWKRLGGHYVTASGVGLPPDPNRIGIADPFRDLAEVGFPGRVAPPPPHGHPDAPPDIIHNDTSRISHEVYRPTGANVPGAAWALQNYVRNVDDVANFFGQNVPVSLAQYAAAGYQGGNIVAAVDYAIAVSPHPNTVSLRLEPDLSTVAQQESCELALMVDAGPQPFDGLEVHLTFDPAALQIVDGAGNPATQITAGTDLPSVLTNQVDNQAGTITFMAGVMGGSVQGRVRAATIRVKGVRTTSADGTPIAFLWAHPRSDVLYQGDSVLGAHQDAAVVVLPGTVTISGEVILQGRSSPPSAAWKVPLEVTLYEAGSAQQGSPVQVGDTYGVTTDERGRFSLPAIQAGRYDIVVKNPHTLGNLRANVALSSASSTLDWGELLEGDVNNDNLVNMTDFSAVSAAYGKSQGQAGWDPRADLNEDGTVNDADVALLRNNMGRSGDVLLQANRRISMPALPGGLRGADQPGAVSILLQADKSQVELGEMVTVSVTVEAGGQAVDAAEVHLVFDPTVLSPVDAQGNPTARMEGGSALPSEIVNAVDSATGKAAYAGGDLTGPGASGTFLLARLRFRALANSTRVQIRFSGDAGEMCDVAYDGESVLGYVKGTQLVAGPTATPVALVRLPLLLKSR